MDLGRRPVPPVPGRAGGGGRESQQKRTYVSLDASGVYALSSTAALADTADRAEELGFTDVITHWPRPEGVYAGQESVLETVAADLLSRAS